MNTPNPTRKRPRSRFLGWFDRYTPRRYRRGDPNNYRRARFILSLSALGALGSLSLTLIFLGPMQFAGGAALCALGTATYLLIPWILSAVNLDVAGHFLVLTFFGLTGSVNYSVGGWSGPLLIWYAFLPSMAALVTKARWSLLWSLLVVAQLGGLHWLHRIGFDHPRLNPSQLETLNLLSILGFLVALLTLTFLYEKFEFQIIRRLQKNNRDLAQARDQALEASHAKGNFLANMSHEFRTPLNAIIGYSEILLEEEELNEHQKNDLQRIREAGSHLLKLVNGLLDLSKAEAGKMEVELSTVSLSSLLKEVEDTLHPLFKKQENRFHLEQPEADITLQTDVLKLKQCLINLLGNATKFTKGGDIRLLARVDSSQRWLCIEVHDTGIGMTPAQMNSIFIPFTQADSSTTRKFGGTGLGLTLARRFAQLLGGDIGVESELGKGSIFTLTVPIRMEPRPVPPPPSQEG